MAGYRPMTLADLAGYLSRAAAEQASAWIINLQDDLDRYGFGFWAVQVRASGQFIGFAGLGTVDDERPFTGIELD